MWGKESNKLPVGATTLVSRSTSLHGDLRFSGKLEIEGQVFGNVVGSEDAVASVRILPEGRVEGEIRAPTVIISGTVVGDIVSTERVELHRGALVEGNIYYQVIEMASGAQVNGGLVRQTESADQRALELQPKSSQPKDLPSGAVSEPLSG